MADADGAAEQALIGYDAALKTAPDNTMLAGRVFRQAVIAGDNRAMIDAARRLEAQNRLPPDARFVLIVDALSRHDFTLASRMADKVEEDGLFAFTVPIVRAWIKQESHTGDPLPLLGVSASSDSMFASYYAEHRAFILLDNGQVDQAVALLRDQYAVSGNGRMVRLQLVSAASVMETGDKAKALEILAGDDPALVAARDRVQQGKPFARPVHTAMQAMAEMLMRLSADVNRERVTPMALTLARASLLADPMVTETRLLTSGLLATSDQPRLALKLLQPLSADDIYGETLANARIQLLVKAGDKQEALARSETAVARTDATETDWTRLADLYTDLGRHADAGAAYRRAIDMVKVRDNGDVPWTLWLLYGGAMEQADRWPEAKQALAEAVRLAPDQPVALNYLGYAQLERRENLVEAEKLIERAAALRPDDPAIADSLGWTYFVRGNHVKAIDMLERAVVGEPGESTINEHLGDAYWQVGRRVEARYAWRAALIHADDKDADRLRTKIDLGMTAGTAAP